jgi:hypothetical protein
MKKLFFILIITFLPTIISAGVWYEPLTGNPMLAPKAEDIEYGSTTVKAGLDAATAGAGANALGYYLLTKSTNAPTNGINLGSLSTGLLKLTVAGGIATPSIASPGTDYLVPAGSGAALTGITSTQISTNKINIALGGAITSAQCTKTILTNYGQAASDITVELPACADNLFFMILIETTQAAKYLKFQNGVAGDLMYLNGVAGTAGTTHGIQIYPTFGDEIVFTAIRTGASTYAWNVITGDYVWTAY